jgi:ABC-type transport system involved in cytochrome bd biosynthesis fused ATPase/permease subunit
MPGFTSRQAVAVVTVLVIGFGVIAAVAFGSRSLAIALIGLLIVLTFFAVVQLRRGVAVMQQRLVRDTQAVRRDIEQMQNAADARGPLTQRQILAALENERLAAADRQRDLLSKISALQRQIDQLSPAKDRASQASSPPRL